MTKKIAIIGTVGIPAKYGGFETLAEYLTVYLSGLHDISVYCSSKSYSNKLKEHNNTKLIYLPLRANGVQSIIYDIVSIFHALFYADVLLILGVSGCIVLPFVKLISSKKVIVNIDGLEWKRGKWNNYAKWFLKVSEKSAVKYADIVVTDNKVVQSYVNTRYGIENVLISYGADHVKKYDLSQTLLNKYDFLHSPYAFTVCRIEPENNLHIILDALSKSKCLPLLIIGNWEASKYGSELRAQYAGFSHIHLIDPIYDQQILNQLRSNCFVYIHGHSAGGTNPSLVEAMFLGLPIYSFGADYNRDTTENSCQYFSDADELLALISQNDKELLLSMGNSLAKIAKRRYRWVNITQQYACLFD